VPQHGKSFVGKAMINRFLDWIGNLPCGVDLRTQDDYDYAGLINSVKVD